MVPIPAFNAFLGPFYSEIWYKIAVLFYVGAWSLVYPVYHQNPVIISSEIVTPEGHGSGIKNNTEAQQ